MPRMFSCFGAAAAHHGVSRAAATSVPRRLCQQQETPHFTAAGADRSAACSAAALAAAAAAPGAQASASAISIWLQPPNTVVRDSSDGVSSPELSSVRQPAAARTNARELRVQQRFPAARETTRRVVSRRGSVQNRSAVSMRLEGGSPQVDYAPDDGISRRRRSTNSSTSEAARESVRRRSSERQLLVLPAGGRAPAAEATSGDEVAVVETLQQVADHVNSRGSGESDILTEGFQERRGSPAGARNRDAGARGGDRSRKSRQQTGRAEAHAPSPPSRPRTAGAAAWRRMFWGERNFSEDAEDPHSRNHVNEEEAAGGLATLDAGGDREEETSLPASSHRRRRRSTVERSSVVLEKAQPLLVVKPCIWITPQFAVDTRVAAGAEAAEGGASPREAAEEAAEEEADALSLPIVDAGRVSSPPEAYARDLHLSEGAGKGTLVEDVGGIAGAAGTRGGSWWSRTTNVGLLGKAFRRRRGPHKRSSALSFFAKRLFWIFCYFVVADVSMSAFSTVSDLVYQHNPQPKLPDRFHDLVFGGAPPPGLTQAVTDGLTLPLLAVTLIRHLFFVQLPLNLLIICRYFFLMATTYWLRGIAIVLTTMPASVPNCKVRPVHSAKDFVENVVLASTFQLPQCTDMIISGHTLSTCLCVATWLFYNNCNKDEAEMQRAPFHIFRRWLLKHRRRSAAAQQERGLSSSSASVESVGHRHQLQQRQQLPEERSRSESNVAAQVFSGSDEGTEGGSAATHRSLYEEESKKNQDEALLLTASAVDQLKRRANTRPDSEISRSCSADVGGGHRGRKTSSDMIEVCRQRAACDVYHKDEVKPLNVADSKDEQPREGGEDAARGEGERTAGEGGSGKDMQAERCELTAVATRVLLRNEAVVGAAAAASGVCVTSRAGGSFRVAPIEGSTVSVGEPGTLCVDGTGCAANRVCAAPFAACAGEGASPSAASTALCAAFAAAAAAVVEEEERESSTHLQEMEDFARAGAGHAAAGAAAHQGTCTDKDDCRVSQTQVKASVGEQAAGEIQCRTEDCLLLTSSRGEGKKALGSKQMDSEFPRASHVFRRPAALGQERPFSPGHCAPVTANGKSDFLGAHAAGGQEGEAAGLVSAFAPASCSARAAVAAVNNVEKLPDDGSSISQCTAGAGSCSSSEEEDGMRALLAPHQSRRHHTEKENTLHFSCCSMPPRLSSFFAATHESVAPDPAAEEEAPVSAFVPVDEAAGAGEEETTGEHAESVKKRYYGIRAQDGEEELERMGHYDSGERRAARGCRGKAGRQAGAGGGIMKGGFMHFCNSCVSSVGRRLVALLWWGCAWNLLGTWCILQAAANIIIIDASFCHYTVDIFFGMMFSFGCFTFYHMIVCLLWAAKMQDDGGAADFGDAYYAVVRVPAARLHRRRSSGCCRSVNSSSATSGTIWSDAPRIGGAARELPRAFSPSRRRAARAAAGGRVGVPDATAGTATARGPGKGVSQANAEIQRPYVERRLGGRGRKTREAGRGGDPSERQDDEDSGVAKRETAVPRADGSTAVALFVMREMESSMCHTDRESKVLPLAAGIGGTRSLRRAATPVEDVSQSANAGTAINAACPASRGQGGAELAVTNAAAEDEEAGEGLGRCRNGDKLQLLVLSQQGEKEEFAPLAIRQQEIREVTAGGKRHVHITAHHLQERPPEALLANMEERREPRLLLWDCGEDAPEDTKQQQSSASCSSVHADKRNDRSRAGGAAPAGRHDRGACAAAGATQSGALRENLKKTRSSKDVVAKGVRATGYRVLQSVDRAISGEPHAGVAADIAISILRFPLIRCAAFFIARLEGLELP